MAKERKIIKGDKIDLIALFEVIWDGRVAVLKTSAIFLVFGLLIGLTTPNEYEASTKLLPELAEGASPDMGGLSSLAGLAGINLSGLSTESGVLSPYLYPEIVNSLPFVLDVMSDTIFFENYNTHTTSFDFFENVSRKPLLKVVFKYTFGLPKLIVDLFSEEKEPMDSDNDRLEYYRLSKERWKTIEEFKDRIYLDIDDETGLILIRVEMPDPYAAAEITKKIEFKVTEAVIEYKTGKAEDNLNFIIETFEEAKKDFEKVQLKLARANDRNLNISSSLAQVELKRIENEYNVAFEVYKGLASQVEQAKIKLREETPVFTILEPVRVPEEKSGPKRLIIALIMAIMGAITALVWMVIKETIRK